MTTTDTTKTAIEGTQKTRKIFGVTLSDKFIHNMGQIVLWLLLLTSITMTPIMMRVSYFEPKTHKILKNKFIQPSAHATSFLTSIILGLAVTFFTEGMKGVKECFNFKGILLLAPVSIGYSLSEVLALVAMGTCAPMMYAAIHKTRLLLAAVMTRVFLKRYISPLQWIICITVTFIVMGFVLYSIKTGGENSITGILLLVANITLSVGCSIYADFSYKKNPASFQVQMVQGRFTAFTSSALVTVGLLLKNGALSKGPFWGPQGGWDGYVLLLVGFLIARDWITTINLKVLDALYKSLAGSAAVATTYVVDCLLFSNPIVPTKLCLVFAIMFGVVIYTLVKGLEKKSSTLETKVAELQAKIRSFEDDHFEVEH